MTNESSDSDTDDDSSSNASRNDGRVKNFFKNLFSKRDAGKSNKAENIKMQDKSVAKQQQRSKVEKSIPKSESTNAIEPKLNEIKPVLHPFLVLDNKDPNKFVEYRSKVIKTAEEFR